MPKDVQFTLIDDGTLDTVLVCNVCGHELRYAGNDNDAESREQWIDYCFVDAVETHDCGENA